MIKSLSLSNFRNFEQATLPSLSSSVVLIGDNGQGKSSLLEAIFLLSNLRSFRTSNLKELRKLGAENFSACCDVLRKGSWTTRLEFRADGFSKQLRIDGIPITKASDFVRKFKTVAFLPDDPILVSGPSNIRRHFLDMFISMVSKEYFSAIQKYYNALKSRNFMLKTGKFDGAVIASFDSVMASSGARVNSERRLFISMLSEVMTKNIVEIKPELAKINLKLKCPVEFDGEAVFLDRLSKDLPKDRQKGFTSFGPHLDDFEISIDSKNLRNYGSRGQCRIASLCLKLAEFEIVLSSMDGADSVVIVDDSTGDLDQKTKDAFFERISKASQVFYAFTSDPQEQTLKASQRFKINDAKITME